MKREQLLNFIASLGKKHSDLIAEGLIPAVSLSEVFPGSDTIYYEPEEGVSMTFSPDEKVFEKLFVTLKKSTPSTIEYQDELPDGLEKTMSQALVHARFGTPIESRGPVKLPLPVGLTGGCDIYPYATDRFPATCIVFSYTAEKKVEELVFKLRV